MQRYAVLKIAFVFDKEGEFYFDFILLKMI